MKKISTVAKRGNEIFKEPELWSSFSVDCTVDAPSAEKGAICGIHDHIYVLFGDIA